MMSLHIIKSDLIIFSLAVVLAMSLMLSLFFHKVRWVLMPIAISIIGALFMTGLISAIGWKVTVISANFFSLLLVMTLSVIIHLVVRYREIYKSIQTGMSNDEITRRTLEEMIEAMPLYCSHNDSCICFTHHKQCSACN